MPPNVFVIGTMNTADRSIALVDAAMRRRFSFVALHPSEEPTRSMLPKWLAREGLPQDSAALLERLNREIPDPDFKIGPSYLMRRSVYDDGGHASPRAGNVVGTTRRSARTRRPVGGNTLHRAWPSTAPPPGRTPRSP